MSDLTITIMLAVFGALLPALFIDWLIRRKKKYRDVQLMIRPLRFGQPIQFPFRFVFPGERGYCDLSRVNPGPQLLRTILVVVGAGIFIAFNPNGTTDLRLLMATIGLAALLGVATSLAITIYWRR